MSDLRSFKLLTCAKALFYIENADGVWSNGTDFFSNKQQIKYQVRYLQRAEEILLSKGLIEHLDEGGELQHDGTP